MRKSLWIMLAVLFVAIGPPDARANDSVVTLDVSGTMLPVYAAETCAPSPCKLGGYIVIDETQGIVTSVNITLAGASPSLSPFNCCAGFVPQDSMLVLGNNNPNQPLALGLTGIDNLVNYTGGPIGSFVFTIPTVPPFFNVIYQGETGALTEVTVTPEPNSGGLWLIGGGLMLFVMRKRRGRGLPQAS